MSSQRQTVSDNDQRLSDDWLLTCWNPDHIHFGLFEPGDRIDFGRTFEYPHADLARALVRMIDEITEPARICAGEHVVDAGCGVGGTARWLAGRYGCRVTGVDISNLKLDIARQRTQDAGLEGMVDFREADCCIHLPFADGAVDVVVNVESACQYAHRPQFLSEVRRILRPGGRLAASDWLMTDRTSPAEREAYIRPLCRVWALPLLESRASYLHLLREAGLETAGVLDFGGRDLHNAELIGRRGRIMFMRAMSNATAPDHWIEQMQALSAVHAAWIRGFFELGRYLARRPQVQEQPANPAT
ncbi:methyltransferase domain-containing protein [Hoeflea sp.]|uniref:methyltransferase domain-containing protein n=1 Tax=Hoeflea sp. TaxID=1940281 RepID=UPI003B02813F